jgi:hypothetical protein
MRHMDPVIDSVVSRLLATDADAQAFGRDKLTRLVELIELLRAERPHKDRLLSQRQLADYLRVRPTELEHILEHKPGLNPVIRTDRECYFRAEHVYRWMDRLHISEVKK